MGEQRFRLEQDDSGHWYAIPTEQKMQFDEWLLSFENYEGLIYDGPDFEEYRLNMHPSNYTFTDFQEDK